MEDFSIRQAVAILLITLFFIGVFEGATMAVMTIQRYGGNRWLTIILLVIAIFIIGGFL
jgi:hypothetical protein